MPHDRAVPKPSVTGQSAKGQSANGVSATGDSATGAATALERTVLEGTELDEMGAMVSPYLLKPARTLEQALRDREVGRRQIPGPTPRSAEEDTNVSRRRGGPAESGPRHQAPPR